MTAKVLYCQQCGEGQVLAPGADLRACQACGHLRFHTLHPGRRSPHWRWPGPTGYDRTMLRELRIGWEDE